jgi:Protein of unknown function (DUF1353)
MVRRVEVDREVTVERAVREVVDDASRPMDGVVISPGIAKPASIGEPSRFFNPTNPGQPPRIQLERTYTSGREVFRLCQPIGYWDAEVGAVIVPDNLAAFRTDLTSVKRFFTWLVSTTGIHLPAALIHDGLIPGRREPSSYVASREIDRVTADRIFRSGMHDLGTSWVQRWLIWAAVATATMVSRPILRSWRSWLAVCLTVGVVLAAGTLATLDVFDCRAPLPWMADRPAWAEVLTGVVAAFVIPFVLSGLWGRQWRAGAIVGVALALLLHVTVAVAIVFAVFAVLDALFEGQWVRALRWAVIAAGGPLVIMVVVIWACL